MIQAMPPMRAGHGTRWRRRSRDRSPLLLCGLAVASIGCGEDVHVKVQMGECNVETVAATQSVDVVLRRDDGATWLPPCAPVAAPLASIGDLTQLLSRSFTFREVPAGGRWTLAVKGFSDKRCEQAVFCGRSDDLSLPPPGAEIVVQVNCPPMYSDVEDYKRCIRE